MPTTWYLAILVATVDDNDDRRTNWLLYSLRMHTGNNVLLNRFTGNDATDEILKWCMIYHRDKKGVQIGSSIALTDILNWSAYNKMTLDRQWHLVINYSKVHDACRTVNRPCFFSVMQQCKYAGRVLFCGVRLSTLSSVATICVMY